LCPTTEIYEEFSKSFPVDWKEKNHVQLNAIHELLRDATRTPVEVIVRLILDCPAEDFELALTPAVFVVLAFDQCDQIMAKVVKLVPKSQWQQLIFEAMHIAVRLIVTDASGQFGWVEWILSLRDDWNSPGVGRELREFAYLAFESDKGFDKEKWMDYYESDILRETMYECLSVRYSLHKSTDTKEPFLAMLYDKASKQFAKPEDLPTNLRRVHEMMEKRVEQQSGVATYFATAFASIQNSVKGFFNWIRGGGK